MHFSSKRTIWAYDCALYLRPEGQSVTALLIKEANMHIAPYGTWTSPISEEMLVSDVKKFQSLCLSSSVLYWTECRPIEKGRCTIMKYQNGKTEEVLDQNYCARSKIHDYGGGEFSVYGNAIYFINDKDQGIYKIEDKETSLVFAEANIRFSELIIDPSRDLIFAIAEKHSDQGVENFIAKVHMTTKEMTPIVQGKDFYACLSIDAHFCHMSFISWSHPNMNWDETNLHLCPIHQDGSVEDRIILNKPQVSITYPKFAYDESLYFLSDESGYWNLYKYSEGKVDRLFEEDVDLGGPIWQLGESKYGFSQDQIPAIYVDKGTDYVTMIDIETKESNPLDLPFVHIKNILCDDSSMYFIGAKYNEPVGIYRFDLASLKLHEITKSQNLELDKSYFSKPELMQFPSSEGASCYGFFYKPCNPEYKADEHGLSPLIIKVHGGPTAHCNPSFNLAVQYWTSKGYSYLELNYSGSTGFGRAYRERLKETWGIIDVKDCEMAAKHLIENKLADPEKIAIKGGSSGGFTVFCALASSEVFKAGVVYYGVSDLELLAKDTHKFELHYLDSLIGPYPEKKQVYIDRSPSYFIEKIHQPVLILQGSEDKIVPVEQSEQMHRKLQEQGVNATYLLFEGEGHGFRKAETIIKAVQAEQAFYHSSFGF